MGRYLRGTKGFSYKYAFAEQENNLGELLDASNVGGGGVLPSFGGGYRDFEENFDVPAIPLLRAVEADGKAVGGEIGGVLRGEGDTVPRSLESVQYALGENIIEVVMRLDAALKGVPFGCSLEGYATYDLAREQWPYLAAYIDQFRDAKLELDELRDEARAEAIAAELGSQQNYLPVMALWILRHAVVHDLAYLSVYESQASTYAQDFWQLVEEWGPPIFYSAPATAQEWFVRGVCETFRGDEAAGQQSLAQAANAGFERATRWLRAGADRDAAADSNDDDGESSGESPPSAKPSSKAKQPTSKSKPTSRAQPKKASKPATAKKPATKKPGTKKPATKKATAKKPATKKPATKKATTKKPVTKKSSKSSTAKAHR